MAKKDSIDARHYDVILAPHITEKSTMASENNAVVFKVANDATKPQIKEAVEAIYSTKVVSVNTLLSKGKSKRWKGKPYKRSDFKKAVVRLAEGEMIDITEKVN
ncbi:MAG: 50S ribosomal protein L23 [Erythrobacter sp.]|jgi:large subunit ribosomal protein L23|uniref:50S ribosomal protein L23 n=1 Tax=Erythrobacter sp. TaxID=1042 RepID=UPI0004DB1192|nr:50S ribosomal protein L23 [Erythrobacter sp. JL475]